MSILYHCLPAVRSGADAPCAEDQFEVGAIDDTVPIHVGRAGGRAVAASTGHESGSPEILAGVLRERFAARGNATRADGLRFLAGRNGAVTAELRATDRLVGVELGLEACSTDTACSVDLVGLEGGPALLVVRDDCIDVAVTVEITQGD